MSNNNSSNPQFNPFQILQAAQQAQLLRQLLQQQNPQQPIHQQQNQSQHQQEGHHQSNDGVDPELPHPQQQQQQQQQQPQQPHNEQQHQQLNQGATNDLANMPNSSIPNGIDRLPNGGCILPVAGQATTPLRFDALLNGERPNETNNNNPGVAPIANPRPRMFENFILEEAVFSTAPVGVHCIDSRGVVLWANAAELNLMGYSKEEYVGNFMESFVYSDRLENAVADVVNVANVANVAGVTVDSVASSANSAAAAAATAASTNDGPQHQQHTQQNDQSNNDVNLITADDKTLYKEVLKGINSGNPIHDIPIRFVTKSGTVIHFLLDCDATAIPIQSATGEGNENATDSGRDNHHIQYYFRCFTRDDTARRIQEMRSNVLFQETNRSLQMLDNFMNRSMHQMRLPLTLMERACDLVTENIEDIDEVIRRSASVGGGGHSMGDNLGRDTSRPSLTSLIPLVDSSQHSNSGGSSNAGHQNAQWPTLGPALNSSQPLNDDEDGKPYALPSGGPAGASGNGAAKSNIPSNAPNLQNSSFIENPSSNLNNLSAPLTVALSATSEARSVVGLASALVQDASALVDDITDLCRFDQGQVLLIEKEAVKVRDICLEALMGVQIPLGLGAGMLEVSLEIMEGAPGRAMTDKNVLQRSLALLMNFAVDAAANAASKLSSCAEHGGSGMGSVAGADGGSRGSNNNNNIVGRVILSVSEYPIEAGNKSACKISVYYTNPPDATEEGMGLAFGSSPVGEVHEMFGLEGQNYRDSNDFRNYAQNGSGIGWQNNDFNNNRMAAAPVGTGRGGSMMRRVRLRESIERGMTSCRRDKLGLGLSLLYHLVGAQGSDLRYDVMAEEPTNSGRSRGHHSSRAILPSMTKFWFLLPMSLDFPERLSSEHMVVNSHHPSLPTPFPKSPSMTSFTAADMTETKQPSRKRARVSGPVAEPSNSCLQLVGANLMGTIENNSPALYLPSDSAAMPPSHSAATSSSASAHQTTNAAAASAKNYPGVAPGARPLVLVVEDTDVSASLLCMHLRKLNCTSHRAENGEVALEMLRAAPTPNMYSLILMDLRMPVMDGFEATTVIKGSNASNIPVVALTGETSEENRRKCDEIGFDDYVTKPLKRPQLKDLLEKFVPGYS